MAPTTANHLQDVLAVLERVERVEGGYIACCPLHADRKRSLRIAEHGDQVYVRCASRCAPQTVASLVEALIATPIPTVSSALESGPFALPEALPVDVDCARGASMAA
jgi:hypothetical protein